MNVRHTLLAIVFSAIFLLPKPVHAATTPYFIRGWNYANIPIGQNSNTWSGQQWQIPYDMADIKAAKGNTVRIYYDYYNATAYKNGLDAMDAKGVKAIIFLWVNYDANLKKNTPYRKQIVNDFKTMVSNLKYHPAIIGWGFGNEVNYHTNSKNDWYDTLNEAIGQAKAIDNTRFYTTANGEVSDIKTYGYRVPNIDVWGANIYRGTSFGTLYTDVPQATSKPFIITEMGFDRRNAGGEDQAGQASRDLALAQEIEGHKDVISGYLFFEWTDEWWKVASVWDHDAGPYSSSGDDQDHISDEEWYGFTEAFYLNAAEPRVKKQSYTAISQYWNSL